MNRFLHYKKVLRKFMRNTLDSKIERLVRDSERA